MIYVYAVLFALCINGYNVIADDNGRSTPRSISSTFLKGKSTAEFNVDDHQYDSATKPVTFACISRNDRHEFYEANVTRTIPEYLIRRLKNGRGLSLLFLEAGHEITTASGSGLMFKLARDWFNESGNNICVVSYYYSKRPKTGCKSFGCSDNLVSKKRLEHTAKLARDLVLEVRNQTLKSCGGTRLHLSRVDVTGFSFGAHVAGRTAQYLLNETGEKVRMLLALDPSRTPPIVASAPIVTIKPDFAEYVQVIHASNVQGISSGLGHVDIYVTFNNGSLMSSNHALAFLLHVATATKRFYIMADKGVNGEGSLLKVGVRFPPQPKSDECEVGIYATLNTNHTGEKFGFSLKNREEIFFSGLGQYAYPIV